MHYDIVQLVVPYTNSFAINRIVSSVGRYEADACVIVTGGNEFYGIPRKSAWMQDIDNYWGLNFFITMKNHRFIQILDRFIFLKKEPQITFPPQDPDEWIVAYESNEYLESRSYFERNLENITQKSDCPIFLVSMPVNFKAKPYRSFFDDKELQDDILAQECAILVDNSDRFTIERWINDLKAWEPETAIYYYCKAMIAEHAGSPEEAFQYYIKALELDAFRVRMDPRFYELIKLNANAENTEHIDLLARINEMSPAGLSITRYFKNGINMNTRGKDLFAEQIRSTLIDYFNQTK